MAPDRDCGVRAEHRFLKFQRDVFPQIRAALAPASSLRTPTKNIAESEKVAENIAEIVEDRRIKTGPARAGTSVHARMAEAVVERTLFVVGKDGISFARLFEFLLGVGIVWIAIGMELHGKLAVSALDLLIARPPWQAKDVVIVALHITGQNNIPRIRYEPLSRIPRNLDHGWPQQPLF